MPVPVRIVRHRLATRAIAAATLAALVPAATAAEGTPGLAVSAAVVGERWHVLQGGVEEGGEWLGHLDLQAQAELGRLFDGPDVRLLMRALYDGAGEFAGRYAGAAQGVSNVESVRAWRLYEAWADWAVGPGRLRVGLYDLNTEFDVNETGGLFLHPAHGIGSEFAQSGIAGPSVFPLTSLAGRYRVEGERWTWAVAVLDGVPGDPEDPTRTAIRVDAGDGALLVAEAARRLGGSGRAVLGTWRYTADFPDLLATDAAGDPVERDGTGGVYALVEGPLAAQWRGFLRLGRADPRVHPWRDYLGAGVVREAPFGRTADAVGLAVAQARNGDRFRTVAAFAGMPLERAETAFEFTYRWTLGPHVHVQPNLQYVRNPSTDPALDDAWIAGVRIGVDWGWER